MDKKIIKTDKEVVVRLDETVLTVSPNGISVRV